MNLNPGTSQRDLPCVHNRRAAHDNRDREGPGTNDGVGPVLRDVGSKVICEQCSNTRPASESVNSSSDENYNHGRRVSFEIGLHLCHLTPFDMLNALTMSVHLLVRTPAVRVVPLVIACSSRSHMNQRLSLSIRSLVLDLCLAFRSSSLRRLASLWRLVGFDARGLS